MASSRSRSAPRSGGRVPPHALVLGAVILAVVLAYANSLQADFVLDSRALILENPVLRQATADNVAFLLTHDYWQPFASGGLYRPLTTLSYLVNYAVLGHGNRPAGYHAVNLLLHVGNVGLVYALLVSLGGSVLVAGVAAALFGLHPVTTEAVTNIIGRADVLAALGVLGGLLCHRRGWHVGLVVCALVACFSKENGVVLLAAVVAHDFVLGAPRAWRRYLLVGCVVAAALVARMAVQRAGLPPAPLLAVDNPLADAGFVAGRLTAVKVLGHQLALLVWPARLSADYSYDQIPIVHWPPGGWDDWQLGFAVAALAALAGVMFRMWRRQPAVSFLLVFAALAALPTANLLLLIGSIMGERFLYLPLAGLAGVVAFGVGWAYERAGPRWGVVAAVVGMVLVACGLRTVIRNRDWSDERGLWARTVQAAPRSAKARKAHAAAMLAGGAGIDAVVAEGERALAIRPDYQLALVDVGGYYVLEGDALGAGSAAARPWYEKSVAMLERARAQDLADNRAFRDRLLAWGRDPESTPDLGMPLLYNNLSIAYGRLGRYDAALETYRYLRRLDPWRLDHYLDIAAMQAQLGQTEDAAITTLQALALAPAQREVHARLVELYRVLDPGGGAVIVDAPGRGHVDLEVPLVRRHRCRAAEALVQVFADGKAPDGVAQARRWVAERCRP